MANFSNFKIVRKIAMLFFPTLFALTLLIFNTSLSSPKLIVEITSSTSGTAQLFFLKSGNYTEARSSTYPINLGENKLRFDFNSHNSPFRLDPLQTGGTITIRKTYLSIFNIDYAIENSNIKSLNQIDNISYENNFAAITISNQSNDPQLEVSFDAKSVNETRLLLSLLISAIISLLVILLITCRTLISTALEKSDNYIRQIISSLYSENFRWREIGRLFLIGSIFYGYFLNDFSLSIDDEIGALRELPELWIGQGRWTVYFIEQFIFPQPAIPFAPFIVLCACLAISYTILIKLHGFESSWKTYICYPVFCSYPTWWFISEFYSNIPALAFGVLLVTIASHITFKDISLKHQVIRLTIGKAVLVAFLLATAIGAYQSLILLYLAIGVGVTYTTARRTGNDSRSLIRAPLIRLITIGFLGFLGAITYSFINSYAQKISGMNSGYLNNFLNLELMATTPLKLIYAVILEGAKVYTGQISKFGASSGAAIILLVAATLSNITTDIKKSIVLTILWGTVLLVPFLLHLLAGADGIPMRTMVTLSYTTWLMAIVLLSAPRPSLVLVGAAVVLVYQLQIFGLTSQYMASASITQSHDRMLAADIYRRMGELSENFDRDQDIYIDVYGHKKIISPYASGWTSTMQASFFDWDGGNLLRMTSYMQVIGYQNIKMVPPQDRSKFTSFFENMPIWPAKGSVVKRDNTYLIRLSKDADPSHFTHNK